MNQGRILLACILLTGIGATLSACSVISTKAGPTLAKAVDKYCNTVTANERALIRETVNAQIAPRSISVDCADTAE